jgi:hypothetical protein
VVLGEPRPDTTIIAPVGWKVNTVTGKSLVVGKFCQWDGTTQAEGRIGVVGWIIPPRLPLT